MTAIMPNTTRGKTTTKAGSRIPVAKRFVSNRKLTMLTKIYNLSVSAKACESLSLILLVAKNRLEDHL